MVIAAKESEWFGCTACKWFKSGGRCKAYPGGIPIYYASGDARHLEVVPGQTGNFVYELKDRGS